jgi:membrane-bound ClpP family serine protease
MTIALLAATEGGGELGLLLGLVFAGVALFLFLLELFVPSGGLLGLLSAIGAIASVGAFFAYDPVWGVAALAGYAVLAPALVVFGVRVWARSPIGRRMILRATESTEAPPDGEDDLFAEGAPPPPRDPRLELVGAEGVTVTPLRPVGFVQIGARRLDAVAEFGVIEADCRVRVTEIRDNAVRVRPIAAG